MRQREDKIYLGDGVYVFIESEDRIKLYTSDGVRETNAIYVDEVIVDSLVKFIANYRQSCCEPVCDSLSSSQ